MDDKVTKLRTPLAERLEEETLPERRERQRLEVAALARDERDATARAVDVALELAAGLAASPRQPAWLRQAASQQAAALRPFLDCLNRNGGAS